jgi:hypothetical protein
MGSMIKVAVFTKAQKARIYADEIQDYASPRALQGAVIGGIAGSARHVWKNRKDKEERKKIGNGFAQGAAMGAIGGGLIGGATGARVAHRWLKHPRQQG